MTSSLYRQYSINVHAARRVDPTGTSMVRNRFEKELLRRFRLVKSQVRQKLNGVRTNAAYSFPTDVRPDEFMDWLDERMQADVLNVRRGTPVNRAASSSWSNLYVKAAYEKGMSSARDAMSGFEDSLNLPDIGGGIGSGFNRSIHADRVALAYMRTYQGLEGITKATSAQISRTVAEGIVKGTSAEQLARDIAEDVDDIGVNRSRVLARTELVRAHAEGTLNSYEEAGVLGVLVQSEFATARDNHVCPQCADLEGKVYSLEEARGVIPVHPNCRCAWLPSVQRRKR